MATEADIAVAIAEQVAKQVPVKQAYEDIASPAAKQIGSTLEDIIKCIRLVGLPIQFMAIQQDRIRSFIERSKQSIPEDRRILPPPQVLGPILEALRYELSDTSITEMFEKLLSSSMDTEKIDSVHPSFINIVRGLSSDEAKILARISQGSIHCFDAIVENPSDKGKFPRNYIIEGVRLHFPNNINFYMDRFFTLGLIAYDNESFAVVIKDGMRGNGSAIVLSEIGRRFADACIR